MVYFDNNPHNFCNGTCGQYLPCEQMNSANYCASCAQDKALEDAEAEALAEETARDEAEHDARKEHALHVHAQLLNNITTAILNPGNPRLN